MVATFRRTTPLVLLLSACSGPNTGETGPADGLEACLAQWTDGQTQPDQTGPDTQFHGTSTFDGEHIWVAWNRRDSGSLFDVWLERLDCAGQVNVLPVEVTDTDDGELDPVLAVSGDRLLVAWSSNSASSTNNLDIRYRLYDLGGTAVTDVIELEATREGVTVTGNASQPAVVAHPDGFLLAGSWGHEDATAFQSFVVQIDRTGLVVGPATDGELDTVFGQTDVDIATSGGQTHLIWQEDSVSSTAPSVTFSTVGQGASVLAAVGGRPTLSAGAGGLWRVWDTDSGAVEVQPPGGGSVMLDTGGFVHSANIAATSSGATVVAMEQVSGVFNTLVLWRLDDVGQVIEQRTFESTGVPSVYGVDVTMVGDDHALIVYQDGPSPDFRLEAEWLSFDP